MTPDECNDLVDTRAMAQARKHKRTRSAHARRIDAHDLETGADMGRQVGLVNDEQVRARNTRPALAWNFFAAGDVDHIDRQVRQLGAEGRGQVVAARYGGITRR